MVRAVLFTRFDAPGFEDDRIGSEKRHRAGAVSRGQSRMKPLDGGDYIGGITVGVRRRGRWCRPRRLGTERRNYESERRERECRSQCTAKTESLNPDDLLD